ncbi:NAD-dependent protein deacylase [Rhodobacterales bacterium HKCCE4037]|nr:NAD-dependent protein deacylase [Rhodobacterales bacterium HKCCE4037]
MVVLTGAGVSAESGLGTFRDKGGLWTKYDLAEVATPEGFAADPAKVHGFYNARRANALEAEANAAHAALARLEAAGALIVTQNVDDLHERAGAENVIHMHGQLMRAFCVACDTRFDAPREMGVDDPCPACGSGPTRPDIVWFGEMPYHMERIIDALEACELFVAIGTSGEVYPAAGFVEEARRTGAETLEINMEATGGRFDRRIIGPASQVVPLWVDEVLGA